jgi:hypothetical protein
LTLGLSNECEVSEAVLLAATFAEWRGWWWRWLLLLFTGQSKQAAIDKCNENGANER